MSHNGVGVVGPEWQFDFDTSLGAWGPPSSFRALSSRCNHSPTGRVVEVPDGDSIGSWATSDD